MKLAVWIEFFVMISFFGFLALSNVVVLVRASGNVEFVSHMGYVDSEGYYRVVGEVENVGSQAVGFVQVTVTFLDANNAVVDTRFDLTMLNVILPGRKSPFEIAFLNVAESARIHNYTLSATFQTTSSLPLNLRIPTYNSTIDAEGRLHVTGQIENIGNETAINTRAVATFYDSEGKVVAASSTFLDPELLGDLNPNVTQPFEMVLSQDRASYVNTYVLTAECNQYEALPEFPTWISIVLILAFLSSVLAVWKRSKNTKSSSLNQNLHKNCVFRVCELKKNVGARGSWRALYCFSYCSH